MDLSIFLSTKLLFPLFQFGSNHTYLIFRNSGDLHWNVNNFWTVWARKQCQTFLESWEGMPYRNINSKILIVIPRPKTACKDRWFSADNSPNLIAIKSFNFGRQLWQNYKVYSFITNINELHSLWRFQICAALISNSNGFWVISVIVKVTKFPKSKGNSPNLILFQAYLSLKASSRLIWALKPLPGLFKLGSLFQAYLSLEEG